MNSTRLLRFTLPLICLLALVAAGLPAQVEAATPKASSSTATAAVKTAPVKTTATAAAAATTSSSTATAAARRAQLARSRAATLRDIEEPRFKLDDDGALVPDIRAAAIVYNPKTGQVVWEENSTNQRSIASITKVMTATVFLENQPDFDREVVVQPSDVRAASVTYLRAGYRVTIDNLLHLMLIASDNAAARVLARVSPYSPEGFIARMNQKAMELGLQSTAYADPSGLLQANVSSAYDIARLITFAASDQRISSVMRTQYYSFNVGRQTITVHSTNQLVMNGDMDVLGGKTGFISKAGYCLATLLRLPQSGAEVAVVILGANSNAGRFWETRHLFNWLASKTQDLVGPPLGQTY